MTTTLFISDSRDSRRHDELLPDDQLAATIRAFPAGQQVHLTPALLAQRHAVGRRAIEALHVTDDRWVVDERRATVWSIDPDRPDVLEGMLVVCKGAANPLEPEYVLDELVAQLWFVDGTSLLDAVDQDGPAETRWPVTFVDDERRRYIQSEQQTLRAALRPEESLAAALPELGASRRRL